MSAGDSVSPAGGHALLLRLGDPRDPQQTPEALQQVDAAATVSGEHTSPQVKQGIRGWGLMCAPELEDVDYRHQGEYCKD